MTTVSEWKARKQQYLAELTAVGMKAFGITDHRLYESLNVRWYLKSGADERVMVGFVTDDGVLVEREAFPGEAAYPPGNTHKEAS